MSKQAKKATWFGFLGGLALLSLYFWILTFVNSFSHAISQFKFLWYWIVILVVGFSVQVGLYSYIRERIKEKNTKTAGKELVASASISTGSMIACCAHHLVDVLPILGLSALFLFLAKYQIFFILLGIASIVFGIVLMIEIIKKHSLSITGSFLWKMSNLNLNKMKRNVIIISVLVLVGTLLFAYNKTEITSVVSQNDNVKHELIELPTRANEGGDLSIDVTPIDFSFNNPILFEIYLNTHQGDLDFDLTKKAVLIDAQGNEYRPLGWEGAMGGHHLSGKLLFPSISNTESIRLIINDVYGVEERIFEWSF